MYKGDLFVMQPIDHNIREAILEQNGNIAISASAGTGKTHTTVLKIIQEKSENKDYHTFAAITFTRKAAKEIMARLGTNVEDGFVGTNDNFVLREIIQPFMYDVYGLEFKKEIIPDYSNEKVFNSFDKGISIIKDNGFLCKHSNPHNNFSFQLALKILQGSRAAREYLKSKYYRIYIDEYQDSDVDMHSFFMYICKDMGIPIFIVGDIKQSIYGWRGGYKEGFKQIIADSGNFRIFKLRHNFRSNIAIQNYSNMFMDDVRDQFQVYHFKSEIIGYAFKNRTYAGSYINEWIKLQEDCAFLVRRNEDAVIWSNLLSKFGLDFKYLPTSPIENPNLESEHIWIARVLAYYILQDRFSEYDVVSEIPASDSYNFKELKLQLLSIKSCLADEKEFINKCIELYKYLQYESSEKIERECNILYSVVCDPLYEATYNSQKYKHIISTIHASKGLEYKQVIIQASDYNLNIDEDKDLHYVAVSRPQNRLLIVIDYNTYNGKNYIREISRDVNKTNLLGYKISLSDVITGINSPEFVPKNNEVGVT